MDVDGFFLTTLAISLCFKIVIFYEVTVLIFLVKIDQDQRLRHDTFKSFSVITGIDRYRLNTLALPWILPDGIGGDRMK